MEIRSRFDFRRLVVLLYVVCFVAYLIIGLSPAEATNYEIHSKIKIPVIGLESDVAKLSLENHSLKTPDTIVGSYSRANNKTLLIGHSSTIFGNLSKLKIGDSIIYDDKNYSVTSIEIEEKENIIMRALLRASDVDTLKLMTCAGTNLGDGDATHRLIVTAEIITSLDE